MHAPPQPKPRKNWLKTEAEIKLFWDATGELDEIWRSIFRILLLTGARVSEIAKMEWGELDREKRLLSINASERGTKTRQDYFIPLADEIVAILDGLAREDEREGPTDIVWPAEGYVFASSRNTAVSTFSDANKELLTLLKKRGYSRHFIPHDLRRTHLNWLVQLGVRPDIALLAENKTTTFKNLAPSYLWYAYEKEIREVQDKWRDHVLECLK